MRGLLLQLAIVAQPPRRSDKACLTPAGVKQTFFDSMKSLPIIHGIVQRETDKIIVSLLCLS